MARCSTRAVLCQCLYQGTREGIEGKREEERKWTRSTTAALNLIGCPTTARATRSALSITIMYSTTDETYCAVDDNNEIST